MTLIDKSGFNDKTASDVAEIEKSCFDDSWSKESIIYTVNSEFSVFFALYEDNNIAGYVIGNIAADECELYRIAVLKEYRRRGYGDVLMKAFTDCAYKRGAGSVFLEVRSKNTPARSLYEKWGFSLIATRKNYYKNPTDNGEIYRK